MSPAHEHPSQERPSLALRAKPRPVKRFSRRALFIGAAGLACLLSAALVFALQPVDRDGGVRTELYNITHKPMAEGLEGLPRSYDEITPLLGPPLPGDLGQAYISEGHPPKEPEPDNPFRYAPDNVAPRYSPAAPPARSTPARSVSQSNPQEVIRSSGLFFELGQDGASRGSQPGSPPFPSIGQFDPLLTGLSPTGQAVIPDISPAAPENRIQGLRSPYTVMAGTLIPATLVTGINSDLPGQIIGQVTEHVHDTVSGRYLLIPQGAKLFGTYDSRQDYGDRRAFVTWSRLIFPNGNSVNLSDMASVDAAGYAGLKDRVDNYTGALVKAGILSSILGVSTELASDTDERIIRALQSSGQNTINIAGQRIVDRSLNIEPTLTIRPGWRFSVMVNADLILEPYHI